MKTNRILLIFIVGILNCNNLLSQTTPVWATTYTGVFPVSIYENDMVTDKNGNAYVAGYIEDTAHSYTDLVTLKYNSSGVLQWMQQYDSVGYYSKIAVDDSGNVYIGGQNYLDLLTIKYNSLGVFQWTRSYPGVSSYDWVFDIITDDSSNVYITGISHGDKFTTVKYSSTGNLKWFALDGPAMGLDNSYITLDNKKNVYIAARGYDTAAAYTCNTIKYNSFGVKQWERIYSGNFSPGLALPRDIKYDAHGFIYVLAYTDNYSSGDGDFAVIKYDTLGNHIWTTTHSFTAYYDIPKAMDIDKSGNVYVTGNFYPTGGTIDTIVTIKLDMSGTLKWEKKYSSGLGNNDEASDIVVDSMANIYVTGVSPDAADRENFVTIKYDSLGNEIWIGKYGNMPSGNCMGNSIGVDMYGNVYVSGTSYDIDSTGISTIKYSNVTGIQENDHSTENTVSLYPNPATNQLTIEFKNQSQQNYLLEIKNMLGQTMYSETIKNALGKQSKNIDVSAFTNGIYFVSLRNEKESVSKKFIKE
jgi:hypothetical protein